MWKIERSSKMLIKYVKDSKVGGVLPSVVDVIVVYVV